MKHAAWWSLILMVAMPGWLEPVAPREAVAASAADLLVGQPIAREIPVTLPAGSPAADGTPFTVPAGKMLIIEFIAAQIQVEAGASPATNLTMHATLGGAVHDYTILVTNQGVFGNDFFVVTQPVRIYAEGGTLVGCTVGKNGILGAAGSAVITVTGRLVNN